MTLATLKNEIVKEITKAICEARIEGDNYACVTVNTDAGYFDISTNEQDEKVVIISHDLDYDKESPNLEKWVEGIVPDWWDVDAPDDDEEDDYIFTENRWPCVRRSTYRYY